MNKTKQISSTRQLPKNIILLCFALLAIGFLSFHLDITQRYVFFLREQQQMFVYDADFFTNRYISFGGLSLLISQFLAQFFYMPWAGPIITATIGVAMVILLWKSLKAINDSVYMLPLCILPLLFQVDILFDFNYDYQGYVAMFLTVAAFYLYTCLQQRLKLFPRIALSIGITVALYLAVGTTAQLLAVAILLYDLLTKSEKSYLQIVPICILLAIGWLLVHNGTVGSERFAFTNALYYEPIIKPEISFHFSWIAFLVVIVLAFILSLLPRHFGKINLVVAAILLVIIAWLFIQSANKIRKNPIYPILEIQNYVINEEWDKILSSKYLKYNTYLINNYANLALSRKGCLLSNLFDISQQGPNTLMLLGEFAEMNIVAFTVSPYIFYEMGNIATAQNKAFDASVAFLYGNPSIAKMLVKTNMIYGHHVIAEKYLRMLEKTWRYAEWAKKYRAMLYDDAAIDADPELGLKRKDLPKETTEPFSKGVYVDLVHILESNTPDKSVMEYAVAFLVLSHDKKGMREFVEKFYGTPVLKELPIVLQEALVQDNETDLDYCRKYGVSEETISRYQTFSRQLMDADLSGIDPEVALRTEYGKTFWFYSLYI